MLLLVIMLKTAFTSVVGVLGGLSARVQVSFVIVLAGLVITAMTSVFAARHRDFERIAAVLCVSLSFLVPLEILLGLEALVAGIASEDPRVRVGDRGASVGVRSSRPRRIIDRLRVEACSFT